MVTRTIIFRFTRTVVKYADVQRRNRPDIQTELIIIRALVRATGERVKHVRPNVIIFRPDRTNDSNETLWGEYNLSVPFRGVLFSGFSITGDTSETGRAIRTCKLFAADRNARVRLDCSK